MIIRDLFVHWKVCGCCSRYAAKVGRLYCWAGLAWAQMWVHLKYVSDGLALLVLLLIGAREITVRPQLLRQS